MSGETGTAVDVDGVKETITRALAKRSALPPYDELCALHLDLLGHIEALTPLAEKRVDGLWHGSVEWHRKRSQLDSISYEVGRSLGPGLQSAARRVKSLGYTLRFLLENSGLPEAAGGVQA